MLLAFEHILPARAARRAKQHQFVDGEITLFEHPEKLLSHGATSTNNRYFHLVYIYL